jgi:hypothetical protein
LEKGTATVDYDSVERRMVLPMMRKWSWVIGFFFFAAAFTADRDLGIILGGILVLAFGAALVRDRLWVWLPALAITWTWVFFVARDYYTGYNSIHYTLFGISILPIVAWPSILVLSAYHLLPAFAHSSWRRSWLNLSLLYLVGLILFEYIGYHLLGIRLIRGREYQGWRWLDILHIPVWMQIGYLFNGIAFYGITLWVYHLKRQVYPVDHLPLLPDRKSVQHNAHLLRSPTSHIPWKQRKQVKTDERDP